LASGPNCSLLCTIPVGERRRYEAEDTMTLVAKGVVESAGQVEVWFLAQRPVLECSYILM
jgi:hypothetical protein